MRRPWLLGLLAVAPSLAGAPAFAGACPRHVSLRAAGATLPRDGVVLLDVSGDPAAVVAALPKARFVADVAVVGVKVLQVIEGGRLQALLAPVTPLPADAEVHLVLGIDELDEVLAERPLQTTADVDDAVLAWRKAPTLARRRTQGSNKGDSLDVFEIRVPLGIYAVKTPVLAPAFVLARIEGRGTTARAIYAVHDGAIEIGTTGCNSVWWAASAEGPVRVELTAIGAAGQELPAPGAPLRLHF